MAGALVDVGCVWGLYYVLSVGMVGTIGYYTAQHRTRLDNTILRVAVHLSEVSARTLAESCTNVTKG